MHVAESRQQNRKKMRFMCRNEDLFVRSFDGPIRPGRQAETVRRGGETGRWNVLPTQRYKKSSKRSAARRPNFRSSPAWIHGYSPVGIHAPAFQGRCFHRQTVLRPAVHCLPLAHPEPCFLMQTGSLPTAPTVFSHGQETVFGRPAGLLQTR